MSSSYQEVLANFSGVIEQYRQENSSFSGTDNIFGFNPNNNSNNSSKGNQRSLCKQCKSVKVNPNFIPYCGPFCRDHYESKIKYELKRLLQKVGD